MVTEWGMSEKLGPVRYCANQQEVFLGHAITQRQNMSEDTARLIDEEIRRIVTEGEKKARDIIYANRDKLEAITQALMEYETISGEETAAVMRGEKIVRKDDDENDQGPARLGGAVRRALPARAESRIRAAWSRSRRVEVGESSDGRCEAQARAAEALEKEAASSIWLMRGCSRRRPMPDAKEHMSTPEKVRATLTDLASSTRMVS